MIRFIGFDKDGTLFDSMSSYAKVWGKIFHKDYGIPENEASNFLIENAGQQAAIQVENLLKKHNIILTKEEAFQKANEISDILSNEAIALPYPEVPEVLKKLKENGYLIYVSSGQQEIVIKKDLEKTSLIQFIDFYAGIRPSQPEYKKGLIHFEAVSEHFKVSFENFIKETVFIGDTPTDLEISNQFNIPCIIRKGPNSKTTGARFVVDDFSNLLDLIKQI